MNENKVEWKEIKNSYNEIIKYDLFLNNVFSGYVEVERIKLARHVTALKYNGFTQKEIFLCRNINSLESAKQLVEQAANYVRP